MVVSGSFTPRGVLAHDSCGNAMFIYSIQFNALRAERYVPGAGWGTAMTIGRGPHCLAVDSDDTFITVFEETSELKCRKYYTSTGWDLEESLHNASDIDDHHVAANGSGYAVLVWVQTVSTGRQVYGTRHIPGSGWEGAFPISSGTTVGVYNPKVAIDSTGDAIVVWEEFSGLYYNILDN
jgi:hypothetical protein